jgi:hypothetical protein
MAMVDSAEAWSRSVGAGSATWRTDMGLLDHGIVYCQQSTENN